MRAGATLALVQRPLQTDCKATADLVHNALCAGVHKVLEGIQTFEGGEGGAKGMQGAQGKP